MIDWIYIVIIFLALALFFIERRNKHTEKFTNFPPKQLGVNFGATSPEQVGSNGLMPPGFSKWQSGYSKFGPTPPNPRCNITVMGGNCSNIPEDTSTNQFEPICQTSYNTYPTGTRGFNFPLFVMGKSMSRVRQCRNMYNP